MSSTRNQNDSTPQRVDKRVRYFAGQSPGYEDYEAEQLYHMNRQRGHSRWLHAAGICEGLTVTFDKEKCSLTVSPGTAVDRQGRQIVLAEDRPKELPDNGTVQVYVSYNEEQSDKAREGENKGHNMRWHELPVIEVVEAGENPDATDPLLLAEVDIDEGQVDHSVRGYAGLRLPSGGETGDEELTLCATAPGRAELSGDLAVTGNVGIGTEESKGNLDVKGDLKVGGKLNFDTPPMRMERFQLGRLSAIDLDGKDDYVQIKEAKWFEPEFTIEGWVFLRTYANYCRLIDFGDGREKDNVILALSSETSGKPQLWVKKTKSDWYTEPAPQAIALSRWVHVAATFGEDVAKLYLDGAMVHSARTDPTKAPDQSVERKLNYIGKSHWEDAPSHDKKTNGYIDEVRIWNRALSEDEIRAYMRLRVRGDEEGLVACWDFENGKVNNRVPGGLGGQVMGQPGNGLRVVHRDHDTGYSVQEWVAIITASDIEVRAQEGEGGEHLLLVQLDGRWFIRANDIRPDRKTPPEVDVLFMPRGWVTEQESALP